MKKKKKVLKKKKDISANFIEKKFSACNALEIF